MNPCSKDAVARRIEALVRCTLDLGGDVELSPESDLIDEIGVDSIEAYECIAALHVLLDTTIPKNLDPSAVRSISGMTDYVTGRFASEVVERFVALDIEARIASMRSADTLE